MLYRVSRTLRLLEGFLFGHYYNLGRDGESVSGYDCIVDDVNVTFFFLAREKSDKVHVFEPLDGTLEP